MIWVARRVALLAWLFAWLACLAAPATGGERLILERKSPYTSIYVTEDSHGLRVLRFERFGARQSVVKLGDPDHLELAYARMIPAALAFVDNPTRALIVGLGGGTIPGFFHKHLPDMVIDVVDIDPVVVEVAKSHFGFREDARMKAHVADGRRFVENARERYDLIVLDGFGADNVPAHLTTREFLIAVRAILTGRGIVVSNLWGRDANRLYDSMVKTYRAVFDEIRIIDVVGSGNKILIAAAGRTLPSERELFDRAQALSQRLHLHDDLAEIVERDVRLPGTDGETGKLLTDAEVAEPRP